MTPHEEHDRSLYKVLVNHEAQYSILLDYQENPSGWTDAGKSGSKTDCLAYIKRVWNDMRPLSLRKTQSDSIAQQAAPADWNSSLRSLR
jgi:MbtH protein